MSGLDLLASASPMVKAFLAGSMSGTCSTLLFQPLDVLKTRLQLGRVVSQGSLSGEVRAVVGGQGVAGLWAGLIPSLYRTVPGVGLYFASMHWMRNTVCKGKPTAVQSLIIGGAARTFAGSVMIPFTVVKTRVESGAFQYRSVTTAISSILGKEGVRGLTSGLAPTLARDVPFSGLYLAFYEMLKARTPACVSSSSPESAHMLAGLTAGLLASIVTQPADVVKTRMQLESGRGILQTTASLYREAGLRGFTAGLAPRMMRRTVMAALAWTVYEKMTRSLSLK